MSNILFRRFWKAPVGSDKTLRASRASKAVQLSQLVLACEPGLGQPVQADSTDII